MNGIARHTARLSGGYACVGFAARLNWRLNLLVLAFAGQFAYFYTIRKKQEICNIWRHRIYGPPPNLDHAVGHLSVSQPAGRAELWPSHGHAQPADAGHGRRVSGIGDSARKNDGEFLSANGERL